jgi:enediyne biosynthesis protein E4
VEICFCGGFALKVISGFIRAHAKNIAAIILIIAGYTFARLPRLPESDRALLASHFRFSRQALADTQGAPKKFIRNVHPTLSGLAAWISTVGASVALNDLDGDGLANDVCLVDPRSDQVIVSSAPGASARFEPFALDPSPLPFDSNTMAPMGSLPGDFNEDGLIDILVYYWGRAPVLFMRKGEPSSNSPTKLSRALYSPIELASSAERWYTNAATQADIDGDGHTDLIIGNYFPDGARILDANADGREHMQHSMSRAANGGRKHFFLWAQPTSKETPAAQFKEAEPNLDGDIMTGWTLALGAADLDGDLLPEIYIANDFGPDRLLHNLSEPGNLRFELLRGEKTLSTPNSKTLGRDSFKGMGVDFGDVNGDGLLDIYVSNIADEYALEESHFLWLSTGETSRMKNNVAPYVDRSEELGVSRSGWGWDVRFGDFDNDGGLEALQATGFLKGEINRWPELHELAMGNDQMLERPQSWPRLHPGDDLSGHGHNPFFVRARDGRFYDIAKELGLDQSQVSRGIATADIDGDGRLDYAVANQWDASYLYHNESFGAGEFLGLRLLLPLGDGKSNPATIDSEINSQAQARGPFGRPAIGASATVYLEDGRKVVAQVDGGNGHSGKRSPELHFGLGHVFSDTKVRVDLRWRDATGQVCQKTIYLTPGWHTILLAG